MRRRVRLVSLVAALAIVAAWWLLLAPPRLGGKTSYINVSGKSMEPTYVTGDLVVVREQGSYDVGDIVAFRAQGGVVIHRIVGGDGTSGYQLQGDNNDWIDPWNPTDDQIVGKAWFRLPGAARWLLALTHPVVLSVVVTALLAWMMMPAKRATTPQPQPVTASRRSMQFDHYRRALAAVPRRALIAAAMALVVACLLAVPATFAWLDDTQRTSFREHARYRESADFTYTFRVAPTTLYPTGVVGPVDASTPEPPKVFALPARVLDVALDYRFEGAETTASGSYAVDTTLVSDAGWQHSVPSIARTAFTGTDARIELPVDLGMLVELMTRIDDESGTSTSTLQVLVQPRIELATTVGGTDVRETFEPQLTVQYDGTTWAVTSELHADETQRLGDEVTERVEMLGVPVEHVRWLAVPAGVFLVLTIGIVVVAMRRVPSLTIEALLRRPGISVIDLERPPADAELAVPLANPEGIRRVAERDGGLVLRYEDDGTVYLYARHDDRVYCYTPTSSER